MTEKSDSKSGVGGGIGFTGALGITFIVLKLTNVIQWSWFWVLAPLWAGFAFLVLLLLFFFVIVAFLAAKDG